MATTYFSSESSKRCFITVVANALLFVMTVSAAVAQTAAATQYERLQEREKAARAAAAASPTTLRSIAAGYENLVRRYPRSGYSDNALWQGAGLLELAYDTSKAASDKAGAARLLTWLRKEYPTSALAKQAIAKIASAPAEPAPIIAVPLPPAFPVPSAVSKAPLAATKAPAAPGADIRGITHSSLPKGDRITIEMSGEVAYSTVRLPNSERLAIDLLGTALSTSVAQRAASIRSGLLKAVGLGKSADGTVRLTLDVTGQPRFSTFPLYSPFRLVIDLESDAPRVGAAAPAVVPTPVMTVTREPPSLEARVLAPPPVTPAITSRGDYSLARQLGLSVSRIVIDPGHGGHDPGAKAGGLSEAEVVLDVALRLEKLLLGQPGFEVVLTRRDDQYVSLEARTTAANREAADMFVSIHANSSSRTATQGVETFFLNFASNPQAEALAARENASSTQAMGTLPALVKTIALNNKLDESRELARVIQASLVRTLYPKQPAAKNLGVKQAPFMVLIGAQMPSVLAEISFLSNRAEAALLKQATHRQRIAQALCDGIVRYQGSLKKVSTVAAAGE